MARRAKIDGEIDTGQPMSLRTLGRYLNLSTTTVSLVLNNAPGVVSIPQETRDRVIEAAAKFDYRPSFYARSLRKRQSSFTVGVLVPDLNDHYVAQVLSGAEEHLIDEGYFYLTASHLRNAQLTEEYPRLLMDRCVEGFILIDTAIEHSWNLPVVAVAGHRTICGVTNVVLDQRQAAVLALQHLYDLGHRKIAFMRGGSHSSDADSRWEFLMEIAAELALEVRPELTVVIQMRDSTPEMGFDPVNQLLHSGAEFTAILCYNDVSAFGAIRALSDHGLRVPHDISVIGFDDIQSASFYNPSLTTIRQPLQQMGIEAARILLRRIRGHADSTDAVLIKPELVMRESSAAPSQGRVRRTRSELCSICGGHALNSRN